MIHLYTIPNTPSKVNLMPYVEMMLTMHDVPLSALSRMKSGKPILKHNCGFVSWSHTNALACIAFSHNHAMGVDCEKIRPMDYQAISQRYFGSITDNRDDFFETWTAKEAHCKLLGISIWKALAQPICSDVHHIHTAKHVIAIACDRAIPITLHKLSSYPTNL